MYNLPSTLFLALLFLSGCSAINAGNVVVEEVKENIKADNNRVAVTTDDQGPVPDDPFYAPVEPAPPSLEVLATGSLFNADHNRNLYSYTPSFAVGDTITVELDEQAQAAKSANAEINKTNEFELDPIAVPGGNLSINGNAVQLGIDQEQAFSGQSGADQSHKLSGKITVSVIDILNNGNLVVRGEKWLVLNNGKEYIRLTGIVRPRDVSQANTVSSAKVADSRIEFSGTGDQSDAQKQGWMMKTFNGKVWPF